MDTEFPSIQFQASAVLLAEAKMARRGLMEQDLRKLDVTKLHPLAPEVISRQATINIGMPLVLSAQFSQGCLLF